MPLAQGDRLGPYEIIGEIGAGGMGEVYRAHDARLGRDVAIKVSAQQFTERFAREARSIAALNHPNICTLFDVGPNYLVMEYIEGAEPKGPYPLEEALRIAAQIRDALEAAHEKGIVHRDLKPSNIKIKPDGMVKVLDFGLAKVAPSAGDSPETSPTLSLAATQAGIILGTAGYMSPEQARGKNVDKRADIWAFGVVLWEMLTGKRLFDGEDVGHTLASVIMTEPDLSVAPPKVRRLLARCLEKDPKKRLRDIGDAWELLESGTELKTAPSRSRLSWMVAAVLVVALAALAFVHFREAPAPERTLRYTIATPENRGVHSFAISPDGRYVAIAADVGGKRQLWLRALDALEAQPMATTEDATYPFWSPDGRYIGFFAQGKLKKVAANGGPAQSLCEAANTRGGTWSRDDVILFSPSGNSAEGIQRVAAAGGVPADIFKNKGVFRYPVFLPDGRHFLYTDIQSSDRSGIYASSLDGADNRRILPDRSAAVFAPSTPGGRTGYLLFVRENNLMALPFDGVKAQALGDVFPVAEGVSTSPVNAGYAPVTSSESGVLLYWTGNTHVTNQMVWYDRSGKVLNPVGVTGAIFTPAVSPDEKAVAFTRQAGGGGDIWLRDLARSTDTRFTAGGGVNLAPVWSPKGDRIAFRFAGVAAIGGRRQTGIYWKAASGSSDSELLLASASSNAAVVIPDQWSRDGQFIVYSEFDPKTKSDLWTLPVTGADRKPVPFLRTEFNESMGQLSPDSRWMAYASDESGQREVYVRPFPGGEGKWKISTAGGVEPRWRGDGKELFYVAADGKMTAVAIKAALAPKPVFEAGVPAPLFDAHDAAINVLIGLFGYDVTSDGKRFLVLTSGEAAAAPPLTVVVNWMAGLKK